MLNIALVGTGAIAQNVHIHSLKEMDDIKITAVCDINIQRAKAFAEKWDVPAVYESHFSLIAEQKIDAAIIMVWPDQTYRVAHDFLKAGVHCFIEKPPGITLLQAENLLSLSKEESRFIQVGFNRRHIPLMRKVIDIMRETTTINQIEGMFVKNAPEFYDGCADAFVCDTIHAIDMVSWLAESKPENAAMTVSRNNSVYDNAWNAVIKFENGITGIVKANYRTGGRVHRFEIHGCDASAYVNFGFAVEECHADIIFAGKVSSYSMSSEGATDVKQLHLDGKEVAKSDNYNKYYGFYDELRNFFDTIEGKSTLLSSIESAADTMHLVEFLRNNKI